MSDHEDSPFPGMKEIDPTEAGDALIPTTLPVETVGTPNYPPEAAPPPNIGPPPAMPSGVQEVTETKHLFQFQFKSGGKDYHAKITYTDSIGYGIELNKWTGANWVPSTSSLKATLLGSFIMQHQISAMNAADKKEKSPQNSPKVGKKKPAPGAKTPVKG